jgi:poly-gamma-glutamate capsule biosynthesis protein CapA/YwtB (metallophosphatase superfamily)
MPSEIRLFLCGDVMTGRGVDQVLPHPCPPHLFEPYVTSALDYVALAEKKHGLISRPVAFPYVWGAALDALEQARPDVRIVNLETAVTTSEDHEPKGINYRMHPENVPVLEAAGIDCCVLANNHALDWGESGLDETLTTLDAAGIAVAGAGLLAEAQAPAVLEPTSGGRVLVFAFGFPDSGIPPHWGARADRTGVHLLPDFSARSVAVIEQRVSGTKRAGDLAVASIHWGGNWGYRVPRAHRRFAHDLIDRAGIEVVHGHSSHHPKGIEVHRGRPILYGCGDFLTDYEGISGHEELRGDLAVMYLVTLDRGTGRLVRLEMVPLHVRNFRLNPPSAQDRAWLLAVLDRECRRFGQRVRARGEVLVLG